MSFFVSRRSVIQICGVGLLSAFTLWSLAAYADEYLSGKVWPQPVVVTPGDAPGAPPSDAIVLFDGKDLSQWHDAEGWKVADGVATVRDKTIRSKREFGDCQIHLEWAAPSKVSGHGQERGNSGLHIQGKYEVQILDSYKNETYPDGSAAAIYKQRPPLVNATRKPGQWQTYDIIFTAPRFKKDGTLKSPGYVTVLHNGVLVPVANANDLAESRQPGAVPQHLGSRITNARREQPAGVSS